MVSEEAVSPAGRVISPEKGLWTPSKVLYRYFFFITNDREMAADQVVLTADGRCDQENLIAQLKGGVHALTAPVDDLISNWAYMVMASLAWSLKAWVPHRGIARNAPARRGTPGSEADPAGDGVRDVPRGDDRDPLPDRARRPSLGVSLAVLESVAWCVPAPGGAARWLLAVLSRGNAKPVSGCPGPCRPSRHGRG